jgi:apolipoprotein N-acyltransferase
MLYFRKDYIEMNSNKVKTKYIIRIIGLVAYTLSGLNWNIGIAAWIAPIMLLYYSKRSKWSEILFLSLGLAIASSISKSAENLLGIFLIYITTHLSFTLVYTLPFLLEKLLTGKGERFYTKLVFPSDEVTIDYLLSL